MKQAVLIFIKPDGLTKSLSGYILTRLAVAKLDMIACRMVRLSRAMAEEHYKHLKNKPFFEEVIQYSLGAFHSYNYVMAFVLYGEDAIKKCRTIAGATNPEDADPISIRGSCGRITTKGVFENVLHVSSDGKEARREIQLWFEPDDLMVDVFPTQKKIFNNCTKRIWA